jgi:hypothetical protein
MLSYCCDAVVIVDVVTAAVPLGIASMPVVIVVVIDNDGVNSNDSTANFLRDGGPMELLLFGAIVMLMICIWCKKGEREINLQT